MKKTIPIFFTTDDNYVPFLDVAISSLIKNASRAYDYRITVLNTGLDEENVKLVKKNEKPGFEIDFVDISSEVEGIKSRFKNVYHFSVVTYYRLFIASLFPEYDKIIYLDCDLVVTGDVSRLYEMEMSENILAAVPDQFVCITDEFKRYTLEAIGVEPEKYINAGVLLMNLREYRREKIEEKFISLITENDFDLVDPDQAYLNYLCYGRIKFLENGWNKVPLPTPAEGEKNIVHYALYKKPWQYDEVIDGEYFWEYARQSPFYGEILNRKENFKETEMKANEVMAKDIVNHALKVAGSECTFKRKLCRV